MTLARHNFANFTSALPTTSEAPGINTRSVLETATRANMGSAVEKEQEMAAKSASLNCDFIALAFLAGVVLYWANPPFRSEPKYPVLSMFIG